MRQLSATLSPLVRCPSFLLWHVVGAAICIPSFAYAWNASASRSDLYVVVFAIPIWSAFVFASLHRDLLSRPFSFCLPGQRHALRCSALFVGTLASLIASLPLFIHPDYSGWRLASAVCSSWCFGVSLYWIVSGAQFFVRNVAALLGPVLALIILPIEIPSIRAHLQSSILHAPWVNAIFAAALSVYSWSRLGSANTARKASGDPFLALQSAWRRSTGEAFAQQIRLEQLAKGSLRLRDRILASLFRLVESSPAGTSRQQIAAAQYEQAGRLLPLSIWNLSIAIVAILILFLLMGYAPPKEDSIRIPVANAAYVLVCAAAMHLYIPMSSSLSLPIGRRSRWRTAISVAVAHGIVILSISVVTYLILRALEGLVPTVSFQNNTYNFRSADSALIWAPIAYLPWTLLLKLTCRRWLFIPEILLLSIVPILIFKSGIGARAMPVAAAAIWVCAGWFVLLTAVSVICFRRDLVDD